MEKYKELNEEAKKFFLDLIQKEEGNTDKALFERCIAEINDLYEKRLLPIIKWLYTYKKQYEDTVYLFGHTINNYYLLYRLGLNDIDPIKYNLPYEISNDNILQLVVVDKDITDFVTKTNSMQNEFKICKCDGSDELVDFFECYIIRMNDELKNINDLKYDKEEIPIVALDEDKYFEEVFLHIVSDEFDKDEFENIKDEIKKIEKIVKPTTEEKQIQITLLGLNNAFPKTKQDELFAEGRLDIGDLIICREDVYNYLIRHNVDKELSKRITAFVREGKAKRNFDPAKWEKYKNIMKEHNCDDWFIETLEQVDYLFAKSYGIKLAKRIYE